MDDQTRPLTRLKTTLTRDCHACEAPREITLPDHPAGLGHCTTCGAWLDLTDEPPEGRREYLACYGSPEA